MARVYVADDDTFAFRAYARPQVGITDFIQNQMSQAAGMLDSVGQVLFRNAQTIYQNSQMNPALRIASAAIRQVQSLWGNDTIQPLSELWKLQNAPPSMVPWIMAHEGLSKLWSQQRCDGYQGQFFNIQPGLHGEANLYWQQIHTGMVQMDEETGAWEANTYSSSEDDRTGMNLSFDDQCDIVYTHTWVSHYIEEGRDPTSKWDSDLG